MESLILFVHFRIYCHPCSVNATCPLLCSNCISLLRGDNVLNGRIFWIIFYLTLWHSKECNVAYAFQNNQNYHSLIAGIISLVIQLIACSTIYYSFVAQISLIRVIPSDCAESFHPIFQRGTTRTTWGPETEPAPLLAQKVGISWR